MTRTVFDFVLLAIIQRFDTRPAVTAYPEEPSRLIWQDYTFPVLQLISR